MLFGYSVLSLSPFSFETSHIRFQIPPAPLRSSTRFLQFLCSVSRPGVRLRADNDHAFVRMDGDFRSPDYSTTEREMRQDDEKDSGRIVHLVGSDSEAAGTGGQETKTKPKVRKNGTNGVSIISLQFFVSDLQDPLPRPLDRFQADVDVRRRRKNHTRDTAFAERSFTYFSVSLRDGSKALVPRMAWRTH